MIYAEAGRQGGGTVGFAMCKSTADSSRQMTVIVQQACASTFVCCLLAWGLTALSAQIGYYAP